MPVLDADTLAIGFYLGILLMAATVVILTVIYITRPATEKTVFELQLWRQRNKEIKPPEIEQEYESNQEQDLSPDQGPAVSERVVADSPNPSQIRKILNSLERRIKRLSMKIKFPMRQVKTEEKSQVLTDGKVMEKNATAPGVSRAATGHNSPPAAQPAAAGLPVAAGNQSPSSGAPAPEPGKSDLTLTKQQETNSAGPVVKESSPVVEAKAAEPAKPLAAASQAKPEASQPEPSRPVETAGKEQGQKTKADDMSGLFASEAVDDSETSKLAEGMNDVEVSSLLLDGLDLAKKMKRK